MQNIENQYIFPELERKVFANGGRILFPMELVVHLMFIVPSITRKNFDGVWVSLFFAVVFGFVHFNNLQLRKYCLAKWSFDGIRFANYVKNTSRTIDMSQPFCIATTRFSFSRRYSPTKYRFILIWRPNVNPPMTEMGGYQALKDFDILILPYIDQTLAMFQEHLEITEIPSLPISRIFIPSSQGIK